MHENSSEEQTPDSQLNVPSATFKENVHSCGNQNTTIYTTDQKFGSNFKFMFMMRFLKTSMTSKDFRDVFTDDQTLLSLIFTIISSIYL